MIIWNTTTLDVRVEIDDFIEARDRAIEREGCGDGRAICSVIVPAEVDIDEALEEATVEQLRAALGREEGPGYTQDCVRAVRDVFASVAVGDLHTAEALLCRVFDHEALRQAASEGMAFAHRCAA